MPKKEQQCSDIMEGSHDEELVSLRSKQFEPKFLFLETPQLGLSY